jgi:hypothetical protein
MFSQPIAVTVLAAVCACPLLADFSYQQTSKVTGGAMAGMLKVAGVFSKQAREPIQQTIAVKGDRMATRGSTSVSIIDLRAGTITTIDLQKKTYTVMTLEQMKQRMEEAQQKIQQHKKDQNGDSADVKFKVSIHPSGAAKRLNGMDAKEVVVKMEMEATDAQSGQSGSMVVTADTWMAPEIPGYSEVREFHRRMAEKISWTGMGSMFATQPQLGQGMAEAQKEAAKLEGLPVYSTTSMGAAGTPPANVDPDAQQQQQQQSSKPSLGGLLGAGIGIRRTNNDSSQPQKNSGGQGSGNLLEMTTELSGFSTSPVDDAMFAIPAGFRQIEPKGMQ